MTHCDIQVTGWGGKIQVPRSTSSTPYIKLCHNSISSLCVLFRVLRYYLTLLPTVVPCYPLYQLGPLREYSFQWIPFALVDICTCLWFT